MGGGSPAPALPTPNTATDITTTTNQRRTDMPTTTTTVIPDDTRVLFAPPRVHPSALTEHSTGTVFTSYVEDDGTVSYTINVDANYADGTPLRATRRTGVDGHMVRPLADGPHTEVTRADALAVGDVFSVADVANSSPLYLDEGTGAGVPLRLVNITDAEYNSRRLHYSLLDGTMAGNRLFDDSHVVTRHGVHPSEDTGTLSPVAQQPAQTVIPRTADEAIRRARALADVRAYVPDADALASALQDLARFLPGGELNSTAHEHARGANLCGEYEAIVCPVFGWTPRNGETSSMMRRVGQWQSDVAAHESSRTGSDPLLVIREWAERYARGGYANEAVCDHADSHLEDHKIPSLNGLLETIGWDTLADRARTYEVEVRLERTRTVTEYTYVTVEQTATSEDDIDHDAAIAEAWDNVSRWTSWSEQDEDIDNGEGEVEDVTAV